MLRLRRSRQPSPIGEMLLVTDDDGALRALYFADYVDRLDRSLRVSYPRYALVDADAPKAMTRALAAYFAGDLAQLDAIRVATAGTHFQQEVWTALRGVPVGTTTTYGALATQLGRPRAMRAVGAANGANPVSIVVPCHRIIGANGDLTGYGGGMARKQWLLAHEARR